MLNKAWADINEKLKHEELVDTIRINIITIIYHWLKVVHTIAIDVIQVVVPCLVYYN